MIEKGASMLKLQPFKHPQTSVEVVRKSLDGARENICVLRCLCGRRGGMWPDQESRISKKTRASKRHARDEDIRDGLHEWVGSIVNKLGKLRMQFMGGSRAQFGDQVGPYHAS